MIMYDDDCNKRHCFFVGRVDYLVGRIPIQYNAQRLTLQLPSKIGVGEKRDGVDTLVNHH